MVIVAVILTFAICILIDALVIRRLAEKKADEVTTPKPVEVYEPEPEHEPVKLFHEGHTWVEVQGATISVGLDDFAKRLVGEIDEIACPSPGAKIKKGKTVWSMKFGDRVLKQIAPLSGRILEVNKKILRNPQLIGTGGQDTDWIIKMLPTSLHNELPDLFNESRFSKWIDMQKARFLKEMEPELGMSMADGDEIAKGAAKNLDKEQWEKLSKHIFYSVK